MTGWAVHTLGGIDLRFTDPAVSAYFVEDIADPPEEKTNEQYVALNDGAGARLASFSVGEAPITLDVICLGASQDEADANRDALQAVIDAAISGDDVTYEYKRDAAQAENTIWLVQGGIVRPRWRTGDGNQQIFGLYGRYTSPARVVLTLSKG